MATGAAELGTDTGEDATEGIGARIRSVVRPDAGTEAEATRRRRLDEWLSIAAVVMMPLGIVAILLAWFGASQTPFVFEQVPYVISGGLLGIALVIGGGLLYVGSWIARLTELERDEAEKVREVIAGLREDLADVPALSVAAVERVEAVGGKANPTMFWATPNGSMYHRRDCQVVAGRDDVVRITPDEQDGMQPCGMCDPAA